jgi:hypothetical protein
MVLKQYTLGRSFLQEAYITADYERRNFSIAQVRWDGPDSQLIAISPLSTKPLRKRHTGAMIAGIVIAVLGALSITAISYIYLQRQRRLADKTKSSQLEIERHRDIELDGHERQLAELETLEAKKLEADASEQTLHQLGVDGQIESPMELDGQSPTAELEGEKALHRTQFYELPGDERIRTSNDDCEQH